MSEFDRAWFWYPVRVYYEDTDASAVVYHAAYLRYLERGRTEWLRHLGLSHQTLAREHNVVFTVADMTIRFVAPARLDDSLVVGTAVASCRRASIVFDQRVAPAPEQPPLVQARVRVACVDAGRFRPRGLPAALSQRTTAR